MKPTIVLAGLLLCAGSLALGQATFPTYYSAADLSFTSPGALKFGLYGYDNPALLTYLRQPDMQFSWTDATGKWNAFNRWGLFVAAPNIGFGAVKTKLGTASLTDYRLAVGFGDKTAGIGLAYSFAGGDKAAFNRTNAITLGTLVRADRHLSIGLIGSTATTGGRTEAAIDLGFRPFGNEWLTAFADYGIQTGQSLGTGNWSVGAAVEALPGVRVTGRYFDSHAFAVGLSFSLGNVGLSGQSAYDRNATHSYNTYSIRIGATDRTVLAALSDRSRYVDMNLNGTMKYQRFILFDNSNTLTSALAAIRAAKEDEAVAGIAINTSGMRIGREMLWELRNQLADFKSAGKKVVVFIDIASLDTYDFASVADKIVIDPTGIIEMMGYAAGRTFLKGTLEKIGVGFDEWRFFKYKSANEYLSRDKMSDADREQRQKLLDDDYFRVKTDICESRHLSADTFEQMVNEEGIFLARDALAKGLVDTIGRWEEVKSMVNRVEGRPMAMVGPGGVAGFNLPYDNHWGEPPRIAVIYALGVCAMDEGIRARTLSKIVEAAGNDPQIKAIVLRVDSPGGDAMASDYVAEALKMAKKNKPVIVSQGSVAASGGYWLSMYADTIVAAPNSITGSIGVIGGWFYNKDLKEKLGISTDVVTVGKHADLGFGFTLPFIGVGLPDRNLTEDERAKMEYAIRSFYNDFVTKVAAGRHSTFDKIEPLAQGHVYSGVDGKALGLVDILGGLQTAIEVARNRAGIAVSEDVTVLELPPPGFIDWSVFMPRLISFEEKVLNDPAIDQLRFRMERNGQPLLMLPLDDTDLNAWIR